MSFKESLGGVPDRLSAYTPRLDSKKEESYSARGGAKDGEVDFIPGWLIM